MPAVRRRAKSRAFGHSFPNRKPQKQHIAHRHPKDARHHHKQRHQIRLATERFGGCQRKRRGHRTHRQLRWISSDRVNSRASQTELLTATTVAVTTPALSDIQWRLIIARLS